MEDLDLKRDFARNPIFDVFVALQNVGSGNIVGDKEINFDIDEVGNFF